MYCAKFAVLAEKALFHGAIGIVFVAWLLGAPAAQAQLPDAADVAEGMRLFLQKGNCQACHGWAADGRKMDSQMPDGSNLRESEMNREFLIITIKCGRPGTGMPAFDKFAYSDGRCFGLKRADLALYAAKSGGRDRTEVHPADSKPPMPRHPETA